MLQIMSVDNVATSGKTKTQVTIRSVNRFQSSVMLCSEMQCNAAGCNAMQCNAMQCNAMQCNAAQLTGLFMHIGTVCP